MSKQKIVVVGNGMGEPARLRSEASRAGERPAMDGRAGLSGNRTVPPRTAVFAIKQGRGAP
jgi:hypothetical protein